MNRSRCHRPVADPEANLKHCGRVWAAHRVLPVVLPSGPTSTYSVGLSRTVRAGPRPRRTPPDTVDRICKAGVESSILFVSTGSVLPPAAEEASPNRRFAFPDQQSVLAS